MHAAGTQYPSSIDHGPLARQGPGLLAGTVRSESVLPRLGSVLGKHAREEEEAIPLPSGAATSAQRAGPIRPSTAPRRQTTGDCAAVKYYYEDSISSSYSDSTDDQEYSNEEVFLPQQSNVPSSGQSNTLGSGSPPAGAQSDGVEEVRFLESTQPALPRDGSSSRLFASGSYTGTTQDAKGCIVLSKEERRLHGFSLVIPASNPPGIVPSSIPWPPPPRLLPPLPTISPSEHLCPLVAAPKQSELSLEDPESCIRRLDGCEAINWEDPMWDVVARDHALCNRLVLVEEDKQGLVRTALVPLAEGNQFLHWPLGKDRDPQTDRSAQSKDPIRQAGSDATTKEASQSSADVERRNYEIRGKAVIGTPGVRMCLV